MTRSSFAPELSATFTRVSCWTIRLLGLLHDLEHSPALLLGEGARLGDADEVAHAALVLLVVDLEARPLADGLAVQAVGLGRPDLDDDGLVHLVGDDGAEANLAPAADLRGGRGCVAHSASFLRPRPRLGLGSSSTSAGSSAGSSSAFASGSATARAPCAATPPISNSTRPGLPTATPPSALRLPEPMRVSAGFLVIDLSGKTRIQIWPPRLTWRVMARRAASICRFDIHAASIACRPKSPNATVAPCVAMPWRRPRCILRYLTRLGISISYPPSSCSSLRPPS